MTTPTIPVDGTNPLRTAADWRDFVHRMVTGLIAILGTYQVALADPQGAFVVTWLPAVLGVFDAGLSIRNGTDGRRKFVYAVAGLGQLGLVALGWATDQQAVMITGFVLAALNSVYASQWTATSPVASGK